jgi:uncharacterized membrane protein
MLQVLLVLVAVGFLFRAGSRRWRRGGDELPVVLAGAEAAGIITSEQRERILAHAAETGASRFRLDGATWLGIFAGLFVVAGVSLLIATNWDDIGPLVRVGSFLALLLVIGECAIRFRDRSLGLSVPLELVWLFLPLLGIGLYGQTFQLSGDTIRPFLVWLALTAPLAWLSPRAVVASIHTSAMAAVLFTGNFLIEPARSIVGGGTTGPTGLLTLIDGGDTPRAWLLSLLMLAAITLQSLRLLPRAHRHHFVGIWIVWLFCLLVAETPFELAHEGWIALAGMALATTWIVVLTAMDASLEERATSILVWLGAVYALTFTWHADDPADGAASLAGIAVAGAAIFGAVGGAGALPARRLNPLPTWALAAKLVLVAPVVLALAYLSTDLRLVWLSAILMNVILLIVAIGFMWHGSLVRDARQINLGVLVLVWILITRFLDIFGSMLTSGVGFIVTGLLLAGLAWTLEKTRRRLIAAPPGVLS